MEAGCFCVGTWLLGWAPKCCVWKACVRPWLKKRLAAAVTTWAPHLLGGCEVAFGDIDVSIGASTQVTVQIDNLTIANLQGYRKDTLMVVQKVSARFSGPLALKSVLHALGRPKLLRVMSLELEGCRLNVENTLGSSNLVAFRELVRGAYTANRSARDMRVQLANLSHTDTEAEVVSCQQAIRGCPGSQFKLAPVRYQRFSATYGAVPLGKLIETLLDDTIWRLENAAQETSSCTLC